MPNVPTLYCDVDGVINIYKKRPHDSMSANIVRRLPHFAKTLRVPVKITWREDIIERLAKLPVNLVWLTTWNWEAVEKIEPLTGLKSSDVLFYKMKLSEVYNQRHKYALLKNHQKTHPSPFVWVDDVAPRFYNKNDWLDLNHLIIKPTRGEGLTSADMDKIENFIQAYL